MKINFEYEDIKQELNVTKRQFNKIIKSEQFQKELRIFLKNLILILSSQKIKLASPSRFDTQTQIIQARLEGIWAALYACLSKSTSLEVHGAFLDIIIKGALIAFYKNLLDISN